MTLPASRSGSSPGCDSDPAADPGRTSAADATAASDAGGRSRRAYAAMLALTVGFILYGSLYPFRYDDRPGSALIFLLGTWREWDHRGDLLANIALYVPFGFFLVCALPPRLARPACVALAVAAAAALAGWVEVTQFHDADRTTTMGDVYANAIGSGAGALLAVGLGASLRWPLLREAAAHPVPSLLLVLWAGSDVYPYVPTIDLHKYWHAVRPLLALPAPSLAEVATALVTWLLLGFILLSLYGFRRFLWLFLALLALECLGKVLILDNALTHAVLAGALLAYWGWILGHRLPGRVLLLALAVAALLVWQRLMPSGTPPAPFAWTPFQALLTGPLGPAIPLLCQALFLIGGLIWLLGRAGVPLPVASGLTALLLFATAWFQPAGEATDAVLALGLGAAFWLLRIAATPRRDAMAAALADRAPPDSVPPGAMPPGFVRPGGGPSGPMPFDAMPPAPPAPAGRRHAPYVPPHLR